MSFEVGEEGELEATAVRLTPQIRQMLTTMVRSRLTPQGLVTRGQIVLDLATTQSLTATADHCGVSRATVWKWRNRWQARQEALASLPEDELERAIVLLLSEQPRPGPAPTFQPDQVARLIAMACEPAVPAGTPVSQWSLSSLAAEALRRGIVESISPTTVWGFLKSGRPQALQGQALAQSA